MFGHHKEIQVLTFRALALRRSESKLPLVMNSVEETKYLFSKYLRWVMTDIMQLLSLGFLLTEPLYEYLFSTSCSIRETETA